MCGENYILGITHSTNGILVLKIEYLVHVQGKWLYFKRHGWPGNLNDSAPSGRGGRMIVYSAARTSQ